MPQFVENVKEIRNRAMRKLEEGAVTASYKGDVEKTIQILNEALATEIVCVLRYMHHYFMATGVHGKAVADEFKEHADSEREHADAIAERIQQLGGKPDFNPRSLLERSASQYVEGETLGQMIREDLIAERIVIEVYQDMIRHFGNDDPTTRRMIEGILHDEEEHASDLSDLLYIADPQTGETEGRDPGTDPLQIESTMKSGDGSKRQPARATEINPGGKIEKISRAQSEGRKQEATEEDEFLLNEDHGAMPPPQTSAQEETKPEAGWRPGEVGAGAPPLAAKRHESSHAGPPGAPGFGSPKTSKVPKPLKGSRMKPKSRKNKRAA